MTSVSVVIAAFNEGANLPRLLNSLAHQTQPIAEIIVVDDGSTDSTAADAARFGARLLCQAHIGPARARNAGVRACSGEIVVFIDGDMTASRTYVEALVRPIELGAVGSFTKEIYLGNPGNPWAHAYALIRGQSTPRLLPEDFPDRWDNFRAVRRDAFLAVGGYDDVGYGEDMTLAGKLGTPAIAAPGALCWHYNPASLQEIYENARWIGKGHDIEKVHVLRANNPAYVLLRGILEARETRSFVPLVARCAYHLGVWVGLVEKRIGFRHAK